MKICSYARGNLTRSAHSQRCLHMCNRLFSSDSTTSNYFSQSSTDKDARIDSKQSTSQEISKSNSVIVGTGPASSSTAEISEDSFRDFCVSRGSQAGLGWVTQELGVEVVNRGQWQSYIPIFNECARTGNADAALNLFYDLQHNAIPLSATSYSAVIAACSKSSGDTLKEAFNVYEEMLKKDLIPTIATYNALLNACSSSVDNLKKMCNILRDMIQSDVEPDATTSRILKMLLKQHCGFSNRRTVPTTLNQVHRLIESRLGVVSSTDKDNIDDIFSSENNGSAPAEARAAKSKSNIMHESVFRRRWIDITKEWLNQNPDDILNGMLEQALSDKDISQEKVDALVFYCASRGSSGIKVMFRILKVMKNNLKVAPTAQTKMAVIHCLSVNGLSQLVLQQYDKMIKDGFKPDVVCYTSAMQAYLKTGKHQQALNILDEIKSRNLAPSPVSFSVGISACEKLRNSDKALSIFDTMKDAGQAPDTIVYNALLRTLNKTDCHDDAAQLFEEMKITGVPPDLMTYCAALGSFEALGKRDDILNQLSSFQQNLQRDGALNGDDFLKSLSMFGHVDVVDSKFDELERSGAVLRHQKEKYVTDAKNAKNRRTNVTIGTAAIVQTLSSQKHNAAHELVRRIQPVIESIAEHEPMQPVAKRIQPVASITQESRILSPDVSTSTGVAKIQPTPKKAIVIKLYRAKVKLKSRSHDPTEIMEIHRKNMLLAMNSRHYKEVLEIFEKTGEDKRIPRDVGLFNIAVTAAQKLGSHTEAMTLLDSMKEIGLKPTHQTYTLAISACASARKHEGAAEVFGDAKAAGL